MTPDIFTPSADIFHDGPGATILHGDATRLCDYLKPESVDLIITSPPYFALRSYQDGGEHYDGQIGSEATPADFLAALWKVTEQCQRVLKPSGSMFVNLGDKYAGSGGNNQSGVGGEDRGPSIYNKAATVRAKSLMGMPWRYAIGCTDGEAGPPMVLRSEIIWNKPNGLPESVTDRVRRNHEQWFHLTKESRYFACVDEIREAHKGEESPSARRGPSGENRSKNVGMTHDDGASVGNFNHSALGKLPSSVWTIATEPLQVPEWLGVDHFAAFPQEWPRRLILGFSPPGYCVECDQPRKAVVEKHTTGHDNNPSTDRAKHGNVKTDLSKLMKIKAENPDKITGYACDCDNTDAPTRPAVVLDPFSGTGTVAMVARSLGRYGVGVDLSRDYLKLSQWRIWESGHAAKSIARTHKANQGALDLGGEAA